MAITYGFYNSMNGDRKYDAVQLSSIFDGVIRDGVFQSIGEYLATKPGTGMQVLVSPGKAWFDHTWTVNDALYPLDIEEPDLTLKRYDAVVLETDGSKPIRKNSIKIVKGTPSTDPKKPTMEKGEFVNHHPLAYILVNPGISEIQEKDIEIVVGKDECPFVTSILESVSIEALLAKWESEFRVWFDELRSQMEGDVATNLQNQINELDERITPLETLGGRVETNAYNIAMLALIHAKEGVFPPNTKKMIVTYPAVSTNILDYSGLDMEMSAFRATVLAKSAKIRSGRNGGIASFSAGERIVSDIAYFQKKQLYWILNNPTSSNSYSLVLEDKYNRDASKRRILYTFSMQGMNQKQFDFLKINENTLHISAYEGTSSSYSVLPVILSFDGDNITEFIRSSSGKVNDSNQNLSSMLTGDGALYMYGESRSNYGYVYLLDTTGKLTKLGTYAYDIRGYARSKYGVYVNAGQASGSLSAYSGIYLFESGTLTPTNVTNASGSSMSIVFKDDVFLGGIPYKRTERLKFELAVSPSISVYNAFVIGGELYVFGTQNDTPGVFKYDGATFNKVADSGNEFIQTLYPTAVSGKSLGSYSNMFHDGTGQTGAGSNIFGNGNNSGFLYIEDTYETSGTLKMSFDGLPEFSTVSLYVGGSLKNAKLRVSTDNQTWTLVSPEGISFGTEMHQVINISGSGTLYVKIEFDLGSGYIDYIVGGVY